MQEYRLSAQHVLIFVKEKWIRPRTAKSWPVAADVRRLVLKSEIRNPKSEIVRASLRRLLRFRETNRVHCRWANCPCNTRDRCYLLGSLTEKQDCYGPNL